MANADFHSFGQFERYLLRQDAQRHDQYTLDRIQAALKEIENPHLCYKVIHIAGTSGKGSTGAMLYAMLRTADFSAGLYTSPALNTSLDRIVIDGRTLPPHIALRFVHELWPIIQRFHLTYFEWFTLLAFVWFAKQRVDYAVVEAGMGGRLDATNVVQSHIAVVTDIGLDHTEVLGRTRRQIAREKEAIIKPGALGFTSSQYVQRGQYVPAEDARIVRSTIDETIFNYHRWKNVHIGVGGNYQVRNAVLAMMVAQELRLPDVVIRKALRNIRIPARFQIVQRKPLIIADGAHNPQKMNAFVHALRDALPESMQPPRASVLFSLKYDKNIPTTLRPLLLITKEIIITSFEKSASPSQLRNSIKKIKPKLPVKIIVNQRRAWHHFLRTLRANDLGVVTGSLYLLGDLMSKGLLPKKNML